jgi:ribosomal protein S18 acetylase RimI-like enzyme
MSGIVFRHAESDADIVASFPVLHQLRPHLVDEAETLARVRRQQEEGYRLLVAMDGDRVVGAAGYRFQENLIRGRFVYVDDLIVHETIQRQGLGARLLDEVAGIAKEAGRDWFVLDTALSNTLGQRFYFRWGLLSTGLHFARRLT